LILNEGFKSLTIIKKNMEGPVTEEIKRLMVLEGTTWQQQWNLIKGYNVVGEHTYDLHHVVWYVGSPKNGAANPHIEGRHNYGTVLVRIRAPWAEVKVVKDDDPVLARIDNPMFPPFYSGLFSKEDFYEDVRNFNAFPIRSSEDVIKKIDEAIELVVPKVQSGTKSKK
jgi:hypothetical protein